MSRYTARDGSDGEQKTNAHEKECHYMYMYLKFPNPIYKKERYFSPRKNIYLKISLTSW
jgi:hypothetical protein